MSSRLKEMALPQITLRHCLPHFFAPFGVLIEMGRPAVAVNEGTALRHDVDAFAAASASTGFHLVTSIFEAEAQVLPRTIRVVERHRNSAQLIMPVACVAHAVIVCLTGADGAPDLATVCAFRLTGRQGVIYRAGVWHHPIMALCGPAAFLVQSWQDGTADDCDVIPITPMSVSPQSNDDALKEDR